MLIKITKEQAKKMIDDVKTPDDMIVLNIVEQNDVNSYIHRSIRKKKEYGRELVDKATNALYEDNNFFGIISLKGVVKNKVNITHNILFPQLE